MFIFTCVIIHAHKATNTTHDPIFMMILETLGMRVDGCRNLRVRKYADGTPLPTSPSLDFTIDEPMSLYPMPDGGGGTDNK